MQFISQFGSQQCTPSFNRQIGEWSGENFDGCYQCLTCTLGCPLTFAMDYTPNQIIRMVQFGLKQEVLSCSSIWICASCETCVARCPNGIDIAGVMDALRQMAVKENIKGKESSIPIFHQNFLNNIKVWGRQHELSMLFLLKLKTRDLFSDTGLGVRMLLKRKLKLLPPFGKRRLRRETKSIFQRIET